MQIKQNFKYSNYIEFSRTLFCFFVVVVVVDSTPKVMNTSS